MASGAAPHSALLYFASSPTDFRRTVESSWDSPLRYSLNSQVDLHGIALPEMPPNRSVPQEPVATESGMGRRPAWQDLTQSGAIRRRKVASALLLIYGDLVAASIFMLAAACQQLSAPLSRQRLTREPKK